MSCADASEFSEDQISLAAAILGFDTAELLARLNASSCKPTAAPSGYIRRQQQPGTAQSPPPIPDAAGHQPVGQGQAALASGLHVQLDPVVSGPSPDGRRPPSHHESQDVARETPPLHGSRGDPVPPTPAVSSTDSSRMAAQIDPSQAPKPSQLLFRETLVDCAVVSLVNEPAILCPEHLPVGFPTSGPPRAILPRTTPPGPALFTVGPSKSWISPPRVRRLHISTCVKITAGYSSKSRRREAAGRRCRGTSQEPRLAITA
jgi:hypothetical protein